MIVYTNADRRSAEAGVFKSDQPAVVDGLTDIHTVFLDLQTLQTSKILVPVRITVGIPHTETEFTSASGKEVRDFQIGLPIQNVFLRRPAHHVHFFGRFANFFLNANIFRRQTIPSGSKGIIIGGEVRLIVVLILEGVVGHEPAAVGTLGVVVQHIAGVAAPDAVALGIVLLVGVSRALW